MADQSAPPPDEVSLEEIVQQGRSGASASGGSQPDAGPNSGHASGAASRPTDSSIDALLAVEDPEFAASMDALREQVAMDTGSVEIEGLDLDERAAANSRGLKGMMRRRIAAARFFLVSTLNKITRLRANSMDLLRNGAGAAKVKVRSDAKAALDSLKKGLAALRDLPSGSKLMLLASLAVGAVALVSLKLVLQGKVLPTLEIHYLRSFADVADSAYKYDPDEPMEDFTDPLFHPEHVLLIDKIVLNLRPPGDGSNPMGLFEFYIEGSSAESAVELKDREVEVRDVISRTLEQMSYDELVTAAGKNKAKLILRKNLNGAMTKGRIVRVFFRNVVLKP